ncbi:DNA polymerase III subunit beta [Rhizobium sullae]|uniref:Beta sliding clamp n=1 Tax=Rhizobium sullae TaxID=50338 RepID=A0A2N0D307_RHISU|nr:DNA polymerase III subunit beta [Rhizobium sullae]
MKLTISRQDLARVLTNVGRVVEARTTIPILSSVLLTASADRLQVTGTDLDIVATDAAAATVEAQGAVCVDAKLLADIAKKAGGDVSLSLEGDKLTIKSGRSKFSLATLSPTDFPLFGEEKYDATFEIDLAALFGPVAFAISDESTRYYLNGIFFRGYDGKSVAVATDGHRLSRHITVETAPFEGVIVPRKTVGLLPKGSVNVSISQQKIRIQSGDFILVSKLIDGTFPDYERVIPKNNDKVIVFGSDDMRQAAGRVSVVSSERGRAVKLSFAEGAAVLSVNNPDSGNATDEIFVKYDGEPIDIGFNAAYLTELVGIFPAGDIQLALGDSGSPAVFTSEKADGLLCVLMPMRTL